MERRWTTRTKLQIDVEVLCDGASLRCQTRDIGLGGVFVDVPQAALSAGQNVDLIFRVPASSSSEEHRLRAKVVRNGHEGAGLMFRDFDATAFRSLQRVIKVREQAATSG